MTRKLLLPAAALALLWFTACGGKKETEPAQKDPMQAKLSKYATVKLDFDRQGLSEKERQMLPLLVEAARIMDELFWQQAYGDRNSLLAATRSESERRFTLINYGPWDRLDGDQPFLGGIGGKPEGANFYPADMTRQEFEAAVASSGKLEQELKSLYTLVRRGKDGKLTALPYHEAFSTQLNAAAARLREAAVLAEDPGLKRYLELRAEALVTDNYQPSDFAWMEMKNNGLDIVIGPIETYEDKLFGYKAAYEAYVLIKDREWSKRLEKYAAFLPELQKGLPVPAQYKKESPGSDADLNAYSVVYYAGDCNAGSKTIAINLPNDEEVQLKKGTRRLQLKNAMRAKFDTILMPIALQLIAPSQRKHIQFDAFFNNVMFHEVAHGLGIKNTINGKETVRQALKEKASALEEGKADILGLYMITRLHEKGELGESDLMDNYVTFAAGIFRSVRFGASTAHGVANAFQLSYLLERGAIERGVEGGWTIDTFKMQQAVNSLAEKVLRLQGDGDYAGATAFLEQTGKVPAELQEELRALETAGIPVDVVFEQGL